MKESICEQIQDEGKKETAPINGTTLIGAKTHQVLYLKKGEELFMRLSMDISDARARFTPEADILPIAEEFYSLLASLALLPNPLTLLSAGREIHKFYACFSLPFDDSMESIFETIGRTTSIHKSESGAGRTLSVAFWKGKKRNGSYKDTSGKTTDEAIANINIFL